jgi:hypothetical protein
VVGRDGDVAGGSALVGVVDKFERHAAPPRVRGADDEGGGLDKLKLQLGATSVGASWGVGGIDVLEDDALGPGKAEFLVGFDLGIGIDSRADPEEFRVADREESQEARVSVDVAVRAEVISLGSKSSPARVVVAV